MAEFFSKGKVHTESSHGVCEYLGDDCELGVKDLMRSTNPNSSCDIWSWSKSMVKFPHKIESRHWGSIRPLLYVLAAGLSWPFWELLEEGMHLREGLSISIQHDDEWRKAKGFFFKVVSQHQRRPHLLQCVSHFTLDVFRIPAVNPHRNVWRILSC